MPARIVVVLDEPAAASQAAALFQAQGYDAISLPESLTALEALSGATHVELLVTSLNHGPGKPNGISLVLMTRQRRPGLKALFVGDESMERHTNGLGAFLAAPVRIEDVVSAAILMLDR
jgi:DNA-binding NtrC family response regulator